MILEKQTEGLVYEEGAVEQSTSMVIDADSHIFLMRMLSKFYSDGIGSLIRETASNALDSHRSVGVTEPIIVSLKRVAGNYEFSVEDFGAGIDDVVVENVIKKYGKSTKRNDAKALGAFGLGFKSPLAYGPSFYFIGRKDGIERKWMMYEAEDEENKIDLLYESPTKERNGVKIIVPVKYYDFNSFVNKIKEQLAYFEHVYFDIENSAISNDFSIVRHEKFQWSPLYRGTQMHICLDNVYYPLDWSKMGLDVINIPVALRFSLTDGIFPLPNRETIKYTEEAKTVILTRITEVADYYINKYNDKVKDGDDIRTVFNEIGSSRKMITGEDGNMWAIDELKHFSKLSFRSPKLKGLKKLDVNTLYTMKDFMFKKYVKGYEYRNGRFSSYDNKYNKDLTYYSVVGNENIHVYGEAITKIKKDYLREKLGTKYTLFVRYTGEYNLKMYKSFLNLTNKNKADWRAIIQDFQYARDLMVKDFVNVDTIDIPKEWFEDRKKKKLAILGAKGPIKRRKKLTGEVTGKVARQLERYVSGKECKFEPITIQMADAHKKPVFTIYGNQACDEKIQKMYNVYKKDKVRFVIFSERELKNLKDLDLHNWISMEEFEKGKHIIFRRAVTAYLINNLVESNSQVFGKIGIIKEVSTDLHKKLVDLYQYKNNYHLRGDLSLYKDMVKVAEENKLFDPTIYPLYVEISKTLSKLPFLNPLMQVYPYSNPNKELITVLKNLFKYYKMKIDWVHYQVILNEDPVEEIENIEELEEAI